MFKKKDKLNRELYELHLKAAKEWGGMWQTIHNVIKEKLNHDMEKKYKTLIPSYANITLNLRKTPKHLATLRH